MTLEMFLPVYVITIGLIGIVIVMFENIEEQSKKQTVKIMTKYRIWDKKKNKYYHGDNSGYYLTPDGTVYEEQSINYFVDVTDDVIIEFATGHFDSEGKEIYQGDLLQVAETPVYIGGICEVIYWKRGFVTESIKFRERNFSSKWELDYVLRNGAKIIGTNNERLLK